jgi:hypothetical protein
MKHQKKETGRNNISFAPGRQATPGGPYHFIKRPERKKPLQPLTHQRYIKKGAASPQHIQVCRIQSLLFSLALVMRVCKIRLVFLENALGIVYRPGEFANKLVQVDSVVAITIPK